jgi:hypothetical protein
VSCTVAIAAILCRRFIFKVASDEDFRTHTCAAPRDRRN